MATWLVDDPVAAARSPVLLPPVLPVLGDGADEEAGRWLVRAVVSLLTSPGRDEDDERVLLERFVVPVVVPPRPRGRQRT